MPENHESSRSCLETSSEGQWSLVPYSLVPYSAQVTQCCGHSGTGCDVSGTRPHSGYETRHTLLQPGLAWCPPAHPTGATRTCFLFSVWPKPSLDPRKTRPTPPAGWDARLPQTRKLCVQSHARWLGAQHHRLDASLCQPHSLLRADNESWRLPTRPRQRRPLAPARHLPGLAARGWGLGQAQGQDRWAPAHLACSALLLTSPRGGRWAGAPRERRVLTTPRRGRPRHAAPHMGCGLQECTLTPLPWRNQGNNIC